MVVSHGRNLGPVNPVLYDVLGPLRARAGISDVVSGNNSALDPKTGKVLVPGFTAGRGFDVASGWGRHVLTLQGMLITTIAGFRSG